MDGIKSNKMNYMYIGASGSGKSELAINKAIELSGLKKHKVHFFDLDQTKPLFRSRDVIDILEKNGVEIHFQEQLLDVPAQVGGTDVYIMDDNSFVVIDVGGNETGSRMVGRLSRFVTNGVLNVEYVINPFRPWSEYFNDVACTMESVLRGCSINDRRLVTIGLNPNLGPTTTFDEFLEGLDIACKHIEELGINVIPNIYMCRELWETITVRERKGIRPINLFLNHNQL